MNLGLIFSFNSKEYEDLSVKAKSRFSISLRSLSQPMSLGEIARTWDVCTRAVISENAQQSGGSFSSKYGTWENCQSAAWPSTAKVDRDYFDEPWCKLCKTCVWHDVWANGLDWLTGIFLSFFFWKVYKLSSMWSSIYFEDSPGCSVICIIEYNFICCL